MRINIPVLLKQKPEYYILAILLIFLYLFTISANFFYNFITDNATPELAWSFLHGKAYFLNNFNSLDLISLNGRNYWPLPPLPAILAMPIVYICQIPVEQTYFSFATNIFLAFLLFYFVWKKFNFSKTDSLWLTIMYLFASVYISSMLFIGSYYYAHAISTILIIFSFYEYFGKKRYWLIGAFLGLVLLTRFTAFLAIIFFILNVIFEKISNRQKIRELFLLFVPIIICLIILLLYNYLRFGNLLENGYNLTNIYLQNANRHPFGQFNLKYIPTNIYYYFLETFKPLISPSEPLLISPYIAPWKFGALSFFIISPLWLLLFKADLKNKNIKYLLIASGVILFILLCYYYNGWPQIGPRYFNDFLPMLFVILLFNLQKTRLTIFYKFIISFSALLNIYLFIALFKSW